MLGATRVALARDAYTKALRAARERCTAATWRRLVRAGQNLREALADAAGAGRARGAGLLSPSPDE